MCTANISFHSFTQAPPLCPFVEYLGVTWSQALQKWWWHKQRRAANPHIQDDLGISRISVSTLLLSNWRSGVVFRILELLVMLRTCFYYIKTTTLCVNDWICLHIQLITFSMVTLSMAFKVIINVPGIMTHEFNIVHSFPWDTSGVIWLNLTRFIV